MYIYTFLKQKHALIMLHRVRRTRRTRKLHTERSQAGFKPGPSCRCKHVKKAKDLFLLSGVARSASWHSFGFFSFLPPQPLVSPILSPWGVQGSAMVMLPEYRHSKSGRAPTNIKNTTTKNSTDFLLELNLLPFIGFRSFQPSGLSSCGQPCSPKSQSTAPSAL